MADQQKQSPTLQNILRRRFLYEADRTNIDAEKKKFNELVEKYRALQPISSTTNNQHAARPSHAQARKEERSAARDEIEYIRQKLLNEALKNEKALLEAQLAALRIQNYALKAQVALMEGKQMPQLEEGISGLVQGAANRDRRA